jgi:hypothetical protein
MSLTLRLKLEAVRCIASLGLTKLETAIERRDIGALREAGRHLEVAQERVAEHLREALAEVEREASLAPVAQA